MPPWKSFAIDKADDKLELKISRKGANWNPIPSLDRNLPNKILLRTGLESEGPWIVREYKLTSRIPRQIARGDDASQVFIWAFTWKRTGYAEQPNQFAGVTGIEPGTPKATLKIQDVRKWPRQSFYKVQAVGMQRNRINCEKVLGALNTVCPTCGYSISPVEIFLG